MQSLSLQAQQMKIAGTKMVIVVENILRLKWQIQYKTGGIVILTQQFLSQLLFTFPLFLFFYRNIICGYYL